MNGGKQNTARVSAVSCLLAPLFFAAAALLPAACAPESGDSAVNVTVTGTVTYRERMLLRPGSVLEVSLIDTSRADAVAPTIASLRLEDPGSPPFAFEIEADSEAIDANRRYAVRATITSGGELILSTDTVYPVLTGGAGSEVELLLRMVPRQDASDPLAALPATFIGVLPCADCPGIEHHLDLHPESAFYLKRTYLERELATEEIGSWSVDSASSVLALWGNGREAMQFRIVDANTLRQLDRNGNDIESSLNYSLARQADFAPVTLTLPLRGMYRYQADAGLFTECESGRSFAVAQEGDNAALETAYLAARRQPGDSLLVGFDGQITMRSPVEGQGMRPTAIVDRFTGVWPLETCGARMSRSELLDTNWMLTRIGADPVTVAANTRAAGLVLRSAGNQVTGFGGCNNFTGDFEIAGSSITFGPLAATRRACLEGGDFETRLLAALENSTRFELSRHHLEIFDQTGSLLGRFEARALE